MGKSVDEGALSYLRDFGYELYAGHNLLEHACKQTDSAIKTTRQRAILFMRKISEQ